MSVSLLFKNIVSVFFRVRLPGLILLFLVASTFQISEAARRSRDVVEMNPEGISRTAFAHRLTDNLNRFSREIESAADKIAGLTEDRAMIRRALIWKIYAIPSAFVAASHDNLNAGLLDLWAFMLQHHAFLETGGGSEYFGPYQDIAIATAAEMVASIETLATWAITEEILKEGKPALLEWIEDNPMEGPYYLRKTIISEAAALFPEGRDGMFSSISSIENHVSDLKSRLTIMAEQLPRQSRWHAELFGARVELFMSKQIIPQFAETLAEERSKFVSEIDGQREATLAVFTENLDALVGEAVTQREVAMSDFKETMQESVQSAQLVFSEERKLIVEDIEEQAVLLVEALRSEPVPVSLTDLEPVVVLAVDRVIHRLAPWLLGAGISFGLLVLFAAWIARPRN